MAWPANIAPQTPSPQYDIVAVTSAVIYVQEVNNTYATVIAGAKSRCRIDLPLYDQSTERDEIWAAQIGRGPMSIVVQPGFTSTTVVNGDILTGVGNPTPNSVIPDEIATMQQQSDAFTHTPNHQLVLGQTMIRWYDGVGATGNVVGEVDASRYVSSGGAPPKGVF